MGATGSESGEASGVVACVCVAVGVSGWSRPGVCINLPFTHHARNGEKFSTIDNGGSDDACVGSGDVCTGGTQRLHQAGNVSGRFQSRDRGV